MGDIATAVVAGFNFLWDQARICYSYEKIYRRNHDGVAGKAARLQARKEDMEQRVVQAESRDEVVSAEARNKIERVNALLMDVLASKNNIARETGCLADCFFRCKRIEKIEELVSRLDAILTEPQIERVSYARGQSSVRNWLGRDVHERFEEDTAKTALLEVRRLLSLAGVSIVGVFGTGGVGKTTLVGEVKRQVEKEGLYNHVVFVTVSKPTNPEKIQSQIADSFGLILGADRNRQRRAAQIEEKIKREKNVLIVLDDLWEMLALRDVGIPSPEELVTYQSKVVITTRNEHVCNLMKCKENMVRLDTWPELESRNFFKITAGTDFNSEDFNKMANSVADECGGLPLALVAVANALGDKAIGEWKKALLRLQQSKPPNPDDDGRVYKSIKLSYDYLRKREQMCFLMCCLYPEDHNIENEEIARYVYGLGLFREQNTIEEARGETETIVKKLMSSGLLLSGSQQEQVKMHDVIRDVAIQITSETPRIDDPESSNKESEAEDKQVFMVQTGNHPLREWPIRETYARYTAISVMCHDIRTLPNGLICQKLQILLLQDNTNLEEIPTTFFEKMNALKVLDLSGIQASSVPSSIQKLTTLRTLHLDGSAFTDVSVLGALQQLTILSLKLSIIEEFPQDIGKLINLRMLDLTMCHSFKIPPKVLSGFPNLEELYMRGSFAQWRIETEEETTNNASFEEVINLPRLIVLNVDMEDAKCLPRDVRNFPTWWKFDICVCREERFRLKNIGVKRKKSAYSRNLIFDTSMKCLPDWFIKATNKTEKLKYTQCEDLNILAEYDIECLSSLKSLVVEDSQGLQHVIMSIQKDDAPISGPVFCGLEELRIHDMTIKEICVVELPAGSLKTLKFLEVQQCSSLHHSLLPPNLVKRLKNLARLHARTISVEEVFGFDNLDHGLYLGRLTEIKLFELNELKTLWKGEARLADFSNLTSVSVMKCDKLSYLFSISLAESLSHLKELWVEDCAAMEEIIQDEDGITLQRIFKLPELKALCLMNLPKLTRFYAGSSVLECPSLEHLHNLDCSNLAAPVSSFRSSNQVRENDEHHMKIFSKRMKNPEY